MNRVRLNTKTLIGVGLAGLSLVAVIGAILIYRQPLGPALDTYDFDNTTSVDVPERAPTLVAVEPAMPSEAAAATPDVPSSPTATSVPPGVCGENAVWNILVVGSDAADLYYPQGSDLTRVMRVDFPNKTVAIFAFSRDLWVDASALDLINPSISLTKLGMVFYEARTRSAETDPRAAMIEAVNAAAQMLAYNFGVTNDHYVALDLDKLPEMIDAIGGVPVNIPRGFTDPRTDMVFKAGAQTFDGIQAATYARSTIDTDLSRIRRDHLLVEALRLKLLDPSVWIKIPELFLQFKEAVITDFSPEQMNHLLCLMKEVEAASIIQDGVLEEWTTAGPEGSLLWDKEKVLARLTELEIIP